MNHQALSSFIWSVADALFAHQTMSRQALDSATVRAGLKDIPPGPAKLDEASRGQTK